MRSSREFEQCKTPPCRRFDAAAVPGEDAEQCAGRPGADRAARPGERMAREDPEAPLRSRSPFRATARGSIPVSTLRAGDMVTIESAGKVYWKKNSAESCGPDGVPGKGFWKPISKANTAALIGQNW